MSKNLLKAIDGRTYLLLDFDAIEDFQIREEILEIVRVKCNQELVNDYRYHRENRDALLRLLSELEDPGSQWDRDDVINERKELEDKIKDELLKKHNELKQLHDLEESVYKQAFMDLCAHLKNNNAELQFRTIICSAKCDHIYRMMTLSVARTYLDALFSFSKAMEGRSFEFCGEMIKGMLSIISGNPKFHSKDLSTGLEITIKRDVFKKIRKKKGEA